MPSPPEADYHSWASFNPPIGLDQKRATAVVTELTMKQPLSFSGGDFTIVDNNDTVLFTCKGKINCRMEKNLFDQEGNLIFNLSTSPWSFARKTIVTNAEGEEVLSIRKPGQWKNDLEAHFTDDGTEKDMSLDLDGSWLRDRARITLKGAPVAQVWRSSLLKSRRGITVAPGVDLALAVAICLVFDMIQMEHYAFVPGSVA